MEAKEKAESLIKKHLTAIAEESMDSDKMMLYSAKQCAKITVEELIQAFRQLSIEESGRVHIDFGHGYWEQVKQEIEKL